MKRDTGRVVVVGSGPAGAVAAMTLVERGMPVTMLESGLHIDPGLVVRAFGRNVYRRWPPDQHEDSAFAPSGDPNTRWRSTLAPGGLSNFWTGAVPRFAPADFSEGERLHARYRWPIEYADLAPYYAQMERLLQVVGERGDVPGLPAPESVQEHPLRGEWRAVAAQAKAHGQGFVRMPLADGPRWMIRRSGNAFNSFHRIVGRLRRFPEFELRPGAHAAHLEWNSQTARVEGVQYVDRRTHSVERVKAAAVVIAASPLGSTKLLLQSTSSDFPEGLGNSHGVLGRFLHDHPFDWSEIKFDRSLPVLDQNVYLARPPYSESPPLMAAGILLGGLSKWDRVFSLTRREARHFGVVTFGTMVPIAENCVRLHPTLKDDLGLPALDIHFEYGHEELANIRSAQGRLQSILAAAGYGSELIHPVERLTPGYSNHYGGTVRMHASPRLGVLNGWNRLHDVDNVVVADASCFTTAVEKNPTLTVMALAARAADRLADDLTGGSPVRRGTTQDAVSTLREH